MFGLTGEGTSNALFRMGFIRSFDPSRGTYVVGLNGHSDAHGCKAVANGVMKPYPPGKSVACTLLPDSNWLILGEVTQPQLKTEVPKSPPDAIAT